jgi:hypothetical protein
VRAEGARAAARRERARASSINRARVTSKRCAPRTRERVDAEVRVVHRRHGHAYAAADLVSVPRRRDHRRGARGVGLGAIVVPLPGAIADEQSANADFLVERRRGAEDSRGGSDAGRLAGRIESFTRESCSRWRSPARKLARPMPPIVSPTRASRWGSAR